MNIGCVIRLYLHNLGEYRVCIGCTCISPLFWEILGVYFLSVVTVWWKCLVYIGVFYLQNHFNWVPNIWWGMLFLVDSTTISRHRYDILDWSTEDFFQFVFSLWFSKFWLKCDINQWKDKCTHGDEKCMKYVQCVM